MLDIKCRMYFILKKERLSIFIESLFAEKEGFEPPEVLPSTVFKTAAFDHSATSPYAAAKVNSFFIFPKKKRQFIDKFLELIITH